MEIRKLQTTELKPRNLKAGENKKSKGYNPSPTDSYNPDGGQGFVEKVVNGVSRFVNKAIVKPLKTYSENLQSDFATQSITAGTVVGGAAGAFVGHQAAQIEARNTESSTHTWQEPDTRSKYLGKIPRDYHSWWRWDSRSYEYGPNGELTSGREIFREAPVINRDGSVAMHEVTETISSRRFGPFAAISVCGLVGAIGGAMGGVAVNLIRKVVKGE